MRSFELQTFEKGRWEIMSIFDDRDHAMYEAKRIIDSGRYSLVRIIEETVDEVTERIQTRTVFRGGWAANKQPETKTQQTRQVHRGTGPRPGAADPDKRNRRQRQKSKGGDGKIILYAFVFLAIAIFILFAMMIVSGGV